MHPFPGDLARWTQDGEVQILGRVDRQVLIFLSSVPVLGCQACFPWLISVLGVEHFDAALRNIHDVRMSNGLKGALSVGFECSFLQQS